MILGAVVYFLGAVTTTACAALLLRGYISGRKKLLLWSGVCFTELPNLCGSSVGTRRRSIPLAIGDRRNCDGDSFVRPYLGERLKDDRSIPIRGDFRFLAYGEPLLR